MQLRALVVDDSKPMRHAMREILEGYSIDVTEADNGKVAMTKMEISSPFDLVILDWQMPVMDGLEWLKNVKGNPKFNQVKVVMVTSNHDIIKAIEHGVDRFITKPFSKGIIRNAIVRLGFPLPV